MIKLDGLGSPLRFMFDGGLRPDGFGIPVEPMVIFWSAAVEFVFAAILLLEMPVVFNSTGLLRLWALPLEDADDIL